MGPRRSEHEDLCALLDGLLRSATAARFVRGGVQRGEPLGADVALELAGDDVARLAGHLQIVSPESAFHCMCLGDWAIELRRGAGRAGVVGLHHGRSLRIDGAWSDALLADPEGLLRFLAARGLAAPLEEWERAREDARRFEVLRARWVEACPPVLRDLLPVLENGYLPADHPAVLDALARLRTQTPEPVQIARALLGWYGSGEGPWTGYPSYENAACQLLRSLEIADVVEAARTAGSDGEAFGAARFFARWNADPAERGMISEALAVRLGAVTDALGDDDARARLAHALGPR
jgi:hypothetical protein